MKYNATKAISIAPPTIPTVNPTINEVFSFELLELELEEEEDKLLSCESDCFAQYVDGHLSHVNEVITQYSPEAQTGHDAVESQTTHPSLPLVAEVEEVAVLDKDELAEALGGARHFLFDFQKANVTSLINVVPLLFGLGSSATIAHIIII